MNAAKPAGVILAGGRSRRMGVSHKALLDLGGQPLLAYVIDVLQTQLDPLLLSCGSDSNEFGDFALPLVPDLFPSFRGPLMGLYSALQYLADHGKNDGLVLCPCDAPFIPVTLVQTLLDANQGDKEQVVVISYQGELQPTFSLWQNHHLPFIREAAVNRGQGGLKHVLDSLPHKIVEWASAEPPPFLNINTPVELKAAEAWLDRLSL